MKHAWLWATLWLVLASGGSAFLSVMMRQLWGPVSLALSMPICGAWGLACAWAAYHIICKHQSGGGR